MWTCLLPVLLLPQLCFCAYKIGVGIADCTGPAADIVFMGYAKGKQKGCGIHLRQFSRAYIFDDGRQRAVFVSVDAGMMAHGIRRAVLQQLDKLYDGTYSESNLILSGTHTHSGPGGFLLDLLYDIPSSGFVRESFDALVRGITKSIVRAHERVVDGKVYLSKGQLLNANINRSPLAYLLNPQQERDKYEHDVDKEMVQLKLVRISDNVPIGTINWFPVHPTSMNNTNCLISSDNVGYASILLEKLMNASPGDGVFVGAFASSNLGDVSPNLKGPRCIDTGEKCEMASSTCNGNSQQCIAFGPGEDMFDSTRIIAERLFDKAKELLSNPQSLEVKGPVRHIHQFVDMPEQTATIVLFNGTRKTVKGCPPAMGYSFAAGTTDGPGEFSFSQGTTTTNPFWNTVRDVIFPPTTEDIHCHHPKPILLNTGRISTPYEWQPRIVSTQLVQVGEVVLIAVPGEFTTMAGRRLRDSVKTALGGSKDTTAVIAGLSNVYSSYITTPEEYKLQRYEAASTIYGPHTLTLYAKIYTRMAEALISGEALPPGPSPPDFSSKLISLTPKVLFDTAGWTRNFGDCILQPPSVVKRGQTVQVKFVSGHPRNNPLQGKTFVTVEKSTGTNNWTVIATDADWETRFVWRKTSVLLGGSEATILWNTKEAPPGEYRIRHIGNYKYIFGGIFPYQGECNAFQVE